MVSKSVINKQLKNIGFKTNGWGKGEISELAHIILPGEEIYECVNGLYEGGFALLVATDIRVLLVDKKPLNYLTVEDMRFDMISEMDYSHRLVGAEISISSGNKLLKFRSYNQQRLRKLIGHVQHCMAEVKKKQTYHQDSQVVHLEQINKQLQAYLIAQHQYQMQAIRPAEVEVLPPPPKPSNELADYLYAQSLLDQYKRNNESTISVDEERSGIETQPKPEAIQPEPTTYIAAGADRPESVYINAKDEKDIYDEGMREVFGKQLDTPPAKTGSFFESYAKSRKEGAGSHKRNFLAPFDINPIHIAYAKLPVLLRSRRFGRVGVRNHNPGIQPAK